MATPLIERVTLNTVTYTVLVAKRRTVFLAIAFVVCAGHTIHAQQVESEPLSRQLVIAFIAYGAAQGADLMTTGYALGAGLGIESNPVLAMFDDPIAAGAFKMAVVGASVYLLVKHRKRHPKLVLWTTVGLTAFTAGVAIHNQRLIDR